MAPRGLLDAVDAHVSNNVEIAAVRIRTRRETTHTGEVGTMDITINLPDRLGTRAHEAGLNLSHMLRYAVEVELHRLDTLEDSEDDMIEQTVDLVDDDGNEYVGRFVGKLVGVWLSISTFLTKDHRVIIHYDLESRCDVFDARDQHSINEALEVCEEAYPEIMAALGFRAVIDL